MGAVKISQEHLSFGGRVLFCAHESESCAGTMRFSLFLPPGRGDFPVLIWLSGLTCTEENFMAKAGAQRMAARLGLALLAPDTSPRETGIADEDEDWDLGSGAGFYLDASQTPWRGRYRMESWITEELPELVSKEFPNNLARAGVCGHAWGGHGALTLALRHQALFQSVSAFAPICAPTRCPWGEKAFSAYLGQDRDSWRGHDACELIRDGGMLPEILIDQGLNDPFLEQQLRPDLLQGACAVRGLDLVLRRHDGYDHSYYFVSSFINDHLKWHANRLAD